MACRLKASSTAICLACATLAAQQPERARTEALARRGAERLQALQAEADRLAAQERTVLGELRKLEVDREIKVEELRQLTDREDAMASDLEAAAQKVQQLESQNSLDRPALRARMIELYKLGQARYLRLLLSTGEVGRMGEASRMVAAIATRDTGRMSTYRRRLDELRASHAVLQARQQELDELRADAEQARVAADRAVAARSDLIHRIDTERDLNAELSGELQAAQQKLQATLGDLARGTTPRDTPALPLKPFRGALDWPVAGSLHQRFGQANGNPAFSRGIEIAAPEGQQVVAVHDGTVAFAGTFSGFGNLVILDHGANSFSLYGNLGEIAAVKNAKLSQGQAVGSVGAPLSGAPAVYFELRIDGQSVDPLQWLKGK
jgi:septal ring factor EnvC (AmiA/AmiB activator)